MRDQHETGLLALEVEDRFNQTVAARQRYWLRIYAVVINTVLMGGDWRSSSVTS